MSAVGSGNAMGLRPDSLELVRHARGPHHQYPDGFMLFLGISFSPVQDRGAPGAGFRHHPGDVVTIASPALGALINTVQRSDAIPPWPYGTGALLQHRRRQRMQTCVTARTPGLVGVLSLAAARGPPRDRDTGNTARAR